MRPPAMTIPVPAIVNAITPTTMYRAARPTRNRSMSEIMPTLPCLLGLVVTGRATRGSLFRPNDYVKQSPTEHR